MAITKLNENGTLNLIAISANESNAVYRGRELSEYSWEQIKEKVKNADYSDLRIGDYKTITLTNDEQKRMSIAGIDTYYKSGNSDSIVGHHIDFISSGRLEGLTVQWNTTDDNNGTADQEYPYMASHVRNFLLNTVFRMLPTDLQNVITSKQMLMEKRYSDGGKLENSTNWDWVDLGKLWLPTEYEVFGSVIWGTKGYSACATIQYPLFANNTASGLKRGEITWLATTMGDNLEKCCGIDYVGGAVNYYTSSKFRVPICFRIAE